MARRPRAGYGLRVNFIRPADNEKK